MRTTLAALTLLPVLLTARVPAAAQDSIGAALPEPKGDREPGPDRPAWHDMVTNLPDDWGRSGETVIRVRSLQTMAGLALVTGGLVLVDNELYRNSRDVFERSSFVRSASDLFVRAGDGRTHLAIAGVFGAVGWIADDPRSIRTASETIEGLIASGIVVQVLKHVTGRESPAAATGESGKWRMFPNLRSYQSHPSRYYAFPSGHMTTAMSTLTVIAENYPEATWIRPVGYSIVGLVGVSLVNVGYHWYSDLPLGVALGYMFGMVVAHRDLPAKEAVGGDTQPRLIVVPALTATGGNVGFAWCF